MITTTSGAVVPYDTLVLAVGARPFPPFQRAITVGGDTQRYYRFRTPDGLVDSYDENGNLVRSIGVQFIAQLNRDFIRAGLSE